MIRKSGVRINSLLTFFPQSQHKFFLYSYHQIKTEIFKEGNHNGEHEPGF